MASSIHLKPDNTINKLLHILQNKSYKFPAKDLYLNFDILARIPELHYPLVYAINTYCLLPLPIILRAILLPRVRENLHSDSVSKNYGIKI